ncbi:signal recognition particle protein [Blastopirellula marina]|uniref:Signal recognition particle protein n=1 Tax=Blastopirellula marina TaxID=124 RepID=A0A2S8FP90_9BACT|nr:signal recognition particle protein [Blastopirellula marina]PQO33978.1 signal recognition particle protein [Blastopirellula marina]PTL43764.1 signal recognition particle protein [Blastopirellula marina]
MLDSLQDGLRSAFKTLRGQGRLTESNMREGLKMVENALLEADVSYSVVKDFMKDVSDKAVGQDVLKSLKPEQQLVGIVQQALIDILGGDSDPALHLKPDVTVLMMCGLQGAGKTTTCGKLARLIGQEGKKALLVAADLQRPAAVQQLHIVGESVNTQVYSEEGASDPIAVCQNAVKHARDNGIDVVILDTAGRLAIDEELMNQLKTIDLKVQPDQVYLVVDGMTGQDAVNSAKAFNDALELDGVMMTKLDGDARGGALLSVKHVTGVPIKFIGVSEHMDGLEPFHPDRMASRILGMGDILSMFELAQREFDQEQVQKTQERLQKGQFTLDDFRKQLNQIARPGLMQKMLGLMPGMGELGKLLQGGDHEKEMRRLGGMIDSMTPDERANPKLIDNSRRQRIAKGSGVSPQEVNEMLKQFDSMATMMKGMAGGGMTGAMDMMRKLRSGELMDPTGRVKKQKQSTGKRMTAKDVQNHKKLKKKLKKRRR